MAVIVDDFECNHDGPVEWTAETGWVCYDCGSALMSPAELDVSAYGGWPPVSVPERKQRRPVSRAPSRIGGS